MGTKIDWGNREHHDFNFTFWVQAKIPIYLGGTRSKVKILFNELNLSSHIPFCVVQHIFYWPMTSF